MASGVNRGGPTDNSLIRTKLIKPRLFHDLVFRPRLMVRLVRGQERKLTLIVAPAGYGKTTLAATWLERSDYPGAWLSLDRHDNDLVNFLSYMAEAIHSVYDGACIGIQHMLHAPQLPPQHQLASTLVNDLTGLRGPLLLVLDDFHQIQAPEIHDLMSTFIHYLPQAIHLVIASRVDPPLLTSSLRARGQVMEIRARDLRFSHEETRAFLEQSLEGSMAEPTVALLAQKTEGWIAGLRLVALSLRRRADYDKFVNALSGSRNTFVAEYLMQEVLANASPSTQEFLLRTSILDRFCGPLTEAVTIGAGAAIDGKEIIELLARENLFLISLDDEGAWYRYHHLFQELLRHHLTTRYGPNEVTALHDRASLWFSDNGLIEEALTHALAANNVSAAVRIVAQNRLQVVSDQQLNRIRRWLAMFPKTVTEEDLETLMLQAWVLHHEFRLPELSALLDRVEAKIAQQAPDQDPGALESVQAEVDTLRCQEHYWKGNGRLSADLALRALHTPPIDHPFLHSGLLMLGAMALQLNGDLNGSYELLYNELLDPSSDDPVFRGVLLIGLLFCTFPAGDLRQAERIAKRLLDQGTKYGVVPFASWANHFLGHIAYQRNEVAIAQKHFGAAIEYRHRIHTQSLTQSSYGLALAYQVQGMVDEAQQVADEAMDYCLESGTPRALLETQSFVARLAIAQGRSSEALNWAMNFDPAIPLIPKVFIASPHLTLARVLVRKKASEIQENTVKLLSRLLDFAQSTHNIPLQIEVLVLKAFYQDRHGQRQDATTTLIKGVELAEPGGFIRIFIDEGPDLAPLLNVIVQEHAGNERIKSHARRLLAAMAEQQRAKSAAQQFAQEGLFEPLTIQEMTVLEFLSRRLTDKEIAQELVISVATVKKHNQNIYQKLGVGGRRKAVARAIELGILSAPK